MIPISKAIRLVQKHTPTLGVERIDLADAVGRVLAEDIVADTDLPPFDRSQMDGYAVIAADVMSAPVTLKVVGESAAGHGFHKKISRGQAVRIMTGAPVPPGADTIVKVELTDQNGGWENDNDVCVLKEVAKGTSIVKSGAEIRRGKVVIKRGEIITSGNISVPASFGYARVRVGKRPRIAIMSTGSEIVEINKKPGTDQIRNSNSIMLKALAEEAGALAEIFPIVSDDISNLRSQISNARRKADIVVITGGVSVGKYDLTKAALAELGAEIFFEKVKLKPGKPTVYGRLRKTLVFGLPGNPVSSAVTFHLFVRAAIRQMQGASEALLKSGSAVLTHDTRGAKDRDTLLPAGLSTNEKGQLAVTPLKWLGSSDFVGAARSDSLIFVPAGKSLKMGEVVEIKFL